MARMGFEPATSELQTECSTKWAIQPLVGGDPYKAMFLLGSQSEATVHCILCKHGSCHSFIRYKPESGREGLENQLFVLKR